MDEKRFPIQAIAEDIGLAYAVKQANAFEAGTDIFGNQNFIQLTEECIMLRDQFFGQVSGKVYYKEKLICEITPYGFNQGKDFFIGEFMDGVHDRAKVLNRAFAKSAVVELKDNGSLNAYPITGNIQQVAGTTLRNVVISDKGKVAVVTPVTIPMSEEDIKMLEDAILRMATANAMTKDIDALLV